MTEALGAIYQDVLTEDWSTIQPRTDLPLLKGQCIPEGSRVQLCGTMVGISHANVQLFLSQSSNDGQPLTTKSDSYMYQPLQDVDRLWIFHGGTLHVRAASPFRCEHASLIAEGATAG